MKLYHKVAIAGAALAICATLAFALRNKEPTLENKPKPLTAQTADSSTEKHFPLVGLEVHNSQSVFAVYPQDEVEKFGRFLFERMGESLYAKGIAQKVVFVVPEDKCLRTGKPTTSDIVLIREGEIIGAHFCISLMNSSDRTKSPRQYWIEAERWKRTLYYGYKVLLDSSALGVDSFSRHAAKDYINAARKELDQKGLGTNYVSLADLGPDALAFHNLLTNIRIKMRRFTDEPTPSDFTILEPRNNLLESVFLSYSDPNIFEHSIIADYIVNDATFRQVHGISDQLPSSFTTAHAELSKMRDELIRQSSVFADIYLELSAQAKSAKLDGFRMSE